MKAFLLILLLFFTLSTLKGYAAPHSLPSSLAREVLSESLPNAHAPEIFTEEDFKLVWEQEPLFGLEAVLIPESIEWVRATDVLVIPRAKLKIKVKGIENGKASHRGFSQVFSVSNGNATTEILIALISGEKIEVAIDKPGHKIIHNTLRIQFSPKIYSENRVYYDTSCSPYGLKVEQGTLESNQWMYLSCRMVLNKVAGQLKQSIELYLYWDNAPANVFLNNLETSPTQYPLWVIPLQNEPKKISLSQKTRSLVLSYFVPEKFKKAFIGLGIGPYEYLYFGEGQNLITYAPVLTLYGSYFLSETSRIVGFDATAFHSLYYTDFGIYYYSEQAKFFDRKASLNFLLGGHAVLFKARGQALFRPGAPQGFEFIWKDSLKRSYNMSLGAFIFPQINDKAYYNFWWRWGTAGLFVELNYIAWLEKAINDRVFSRSIGIAIGFPLARFL